jgi:hypothetical protein
VSRSCKQIVIAAALLICFLTDAHAFIGPPAHDWIFWIGGNSFGLIGDDTVSGSVTYVHYGFGRVLIPMHIYAVVGIGSAIPLLIAFVYVFHRSKPPSHALDSSRTT